MMMKANEAYALTVKVLTDGVNSHLERINEEIARACLRGEFKAMYFDGVNKLGSEARKILGAILDESGYIYVWHPNGLGITWEK